MAAIPTFNAEAPAARRAPVMEQSSGVRINPNQALQSINGIAQMIAGMPTQMPTINPEQGQAEFQGMQNLGQGMEILGGIFGKIKEERQKAQGIIDEGDAQLASDETWSKFKAWTIEHPDPQLWESEWANLAAESKNKFMEGREFSSESKENIERRMAAFNQRKSMNVLVDATKATTAKARDAGFMDIHRSIQSESPEGLEAGVNRMHENNLVGDLKAAEILEGGLNEITTRKNQRLSGEVKDLVNQGDFDGARERIGMMILPEAEKRNQLFELKNGEEYSARKAMARELMSDDPERYLKHRAEFGLKPSDDRDFARDARSIINEEQTATLESMVDAELSGAEGIENTESFESLSPTRQKKFKDFRIDGALNRTKDFLDSRNSILTYDAANDSEGTVASDIRENIILQHDGARQKELLDLFDQRTDPNAEPQTLTQRTITDMFQAWGEKHKNGELGNYRLTGKQIKEYENEDGTKFFGTPDPEGTIKPKAGFLQLQETVREIKLSESERLAWEEAGDKGRDDFYVDLIAEEESRLKDLKGQLELEKLIKDGAIKTPEEAQQAFRRIMSGSINKNLDRRRNEAIQKKSPAVKSVEEFLNGTGR